MPDEILQFRFQNLHEFVKVARQNLDRNNWDYLIGGSETETTLAVAGVVAALAMVILAPSLATAAIGVLLLFQAGVYANAPWAGASAEGIHLTPLRRAYRYSAQSTGARPTRGAEILAVPTALVLVALVLFLVLSIATPTPTNVPQNPLPPVVAGPPTPTPSPSRRPSPSPTPSPSPSPSPAPSPPALPSAAPAPT